MQSTLQRSASARRCHRRSRRPRTETCANPVSEYAKHHVWPPLAGISPWVSLSDRIITLAENARPGVTWQYALMSHIFTGRPLLVTSWENYQLPCYLHTSIPSFQASRLPCWSCVEAALRRFIGFYKSLYHRLSYFYPFTVLSDLRTLCLATLGRKIC